MPHSAYTRFAVISISSSGDNTVIAAPASGCLKIHAISFTVDAATVVTYKATATAISGGIRLTGDGASMTLPMSDDPWWQLDPGKDFVINSSNAVNFGGIVWYVTG